MITNEKYTIYIVKAYDEIDDENNYTNYFLLEIIADSLDEAIIEAQRIIPRKNYTVSTLVQKYL
jgi:hypothetical protein